MLNGQKDVWLAALAVLFALGNGFGAGLLIGRQFPARHYEKLNQSTSYLFDVNTGQICNPVQYPTATYDANGLEIVKPADPMAAYRAMAAGPAYPPPCGK